MLSFGEYKQLNESLGSVTLGLGQRHVVGGIVSNFGFHQYEETPKEDECQPCKEAKLEKKKCKKCRKEKPTNEDSAWLDSIKKMSARETRKWDGVSGYAEDLLIQPPQETLVSVEPQAGDVGYAPQGRVGFF